MHVKLIKIEGYRVFESFELVLNEELNIIVGDNETGKSTLLEAINLVLSSHINGRNVLYSLNPYLFNCAIVKRYFSGLRDGNNVPPPRILIEAYLDDGETCNLAKLRGTNNSRGEDCPGLYLSVEANEDFADEFKAYCIAPDNPEILPIEYYTVVWRSFADNSVATRHLPCRARLIDTSLVRGFSGPNRFLSTVINDVLDEEQRISLSMAYRKLKHKFLAEESIGEINKHLTDKKGDVTAKDISVSMDMSSRSTWDSSITAHLDEIPFDSIGKGEQSMVQMKLAIEAAEDSNVLLIEEPENHLSHSNMSMLIGEIQRRSSGRQIILTTHSNFVLNKLGVDSLKLLSKGGDTLTLDDLSVATRDYFMKLPGHDTLRLILSARAILVEGPSDELIVQKAYLEEHGKLPLEDGVEVISVQGLAFKRFLEIGKQLKLTIRVVTDNDGKVAALKEKYKDYLESPAGDISICFDVDEDCPTLEPQLLKANSLDVLNCVLSRAFKTDDDLLTYMRNNKTDAALSIFNAAKGLGFPGYIRDAIKK